MLCYSTPTQFDVDQVSEKRRQSDRKSIYRQDSETGSVIKATGSVLIKQTDGRYLEQPVPLRPGNHIGLAVVGLICFNPPFGIIAVILSIKSNRDYLGGRYNASRFKGKASMVVSIVGISLTILTLLLLFIWPLTTAYGKT